MADRRRKTNTRWYVYGGLRFQHSVAPTMMVTSQIQHQEHMPQQGRLGACFNCGQGGHWEFECRYNKIISS